MLFHVCESIGEENAKHHLRIHNLPCTCMCNNKLGCIHLHQNKVSDYFHYLSGKINNTKPAYYIFVASFWPQHVGVDKT